MLRQEWKKLFKNKELVITVIVMMTIPAIYAGVILSSYWDPYGKTSDLPVAVVNNDKPTEFEANSLYIGEELVNNLEENNDLDWHFVNEETAEKGFKDGDYYMVITIPEDFSKNAATVLDDNPKKMNLIYEVNPGRNFFTETIGKQATNNINQEISESVTKEYTKAIFSKINEMGEGFTEAANGASKVDEGVSQLIDGNTEITENLKKLASSTFTFQNGAKKAKDGVINLSEGATALKTGATQLNDGISQYTDGVDLLQEKTTLLTDKNNGIPKLAAGQASLNEAIDGLSAGSSSLTSGLNQMNVSLPTQNEVTQLTGSLSDIQAAVTQLQKVISQSDASAELKAQIEQLNQAVNAVQPKAIDAINGYTNVRSSLENTLIPGAAKITSGLDSALTGSNQLITATTNLNNQIPQLGSAIDQLASKSTDLKNGSQALVQGTNQLVNYLPQLKDGATQLADGANEIGDGSIKLADGSAQLGEGISTFKDGTSELAGKLTDGADTVGSITTTDATNDMMATPLELKEEKLNEVPNYGHALAPNFISLALYIGALAFNLIFPLNIASMKPTSGRAWWFSKFSLGFVQAVLGALILDAIVIWGMGLQVENLAMFVLISILTALTYMFIIMFLGIALGNPGRFLAMIFLVFQLAASGGMFPVELQSSFFNAINPYMPMTYVIYGFREAMTSSLGNSTLITSVSVLIGCIVVFNLLLLLVLHKRKDQEVEVAP